LRGERDPWKLAKLRDRRVRASEEEVANSRQGNCREEVLFERQQVVEKYDFYWKQIAACGCRSTWRNCRTARKAR
jgi:transposase